MFACMNSVAVLCTYVYSSFSFEGIKQSYPVLSSTSHKCDLVMRNGIQALRFSR